MARRLEQREWADSAPPRTISYTDNSLRLIDVPASAITSTRDLAGRARHRCSADYGAFACALATAPTLHNVAVLAVAQLDQ